MIINKEATMKNTKYSKEFETYKELFGNELDVNSPAVLNTIANVINYNDRKSDKLAELKLKEKCKMKNNSDMINTYGNFYFNFYSKPLSIISPQMLVRFLYTCCFMDYENRLINSDKTPMNLDNLREILNLKYSEFYKTKVTLFKYGLLILGDDEKLRVNRSYCKKGISKSKEKVRVFEDALKDLYMNSLPREHVQLALLYLLLPYINFSMNICCANPTERDPLKLETYTLKELAKILHQSNITRFRRRLLDMTVAGEPVICISEIQGNQIVVVNPRVYFKGSFGDIERMEGLGLLFDAAKNQICSYNEELL
jgi:hypothetical protein